MTKISANEYPAVADMYRSGKTQAQVAAAFGVSACRVSQLLRELGASVRYARSKPPVGVGAPGAYKRTAPVESHDSMVNLYKDGRTLESIGIEYGISRERVRQIIASRGVSRLDGGKTIQMLKSVGDKVAAINAKEQGAEARMSKKWCMSAESYQEHVAEWGSSADANSPMRKYISQRSNARKRGIEWQFVFPEWFKVWMDSGKWSQRALSKYGYVMARYGDGDTPYSVDTVYICTQSQNSKDSFIVSPAATRFATSKGLRSGTGKGYTFEARCTRNPYTAQFAGKRLGSYPTAELARAAYLAASNGDFSLTARQTTQGESHGKAKITEMDVIAIRADARKVREIAGEYGLSHGTVSQIRNRKLWKHVV